MQFGLLLKFLETSWWFFH